MSNRAKFATKLGVITASVGSAVGLGNIWRFPYESGVNGGAAFIFIYMACVLVMGIPVIVAEFVIGRGTHKNVSGALQVLAPGKHYHFVAWLAIAASLMILSFYSVVCGWIMHYLFVSFTGGLHAGAGETFSQMFGALAASPWKAPMWTLVFLFINFLIIQRGIERGVEKAANVLMPLLFVLLIVFCVHSLMLPGADKGLKFLFSPDFSKITPDAVVEAMGQAFFSLSLGLSCLLTYASYFGNDARLVRSASIIALLDTLVAILAGVMIFPAVFSFGVEPAGGPKLVFEVFPAIFEQMPGGALWAVLFFLLLFFAAITSTISMSEISITYFSEEFGMSRRQAALTSTITTMVFGSLCALSFGPLNDMKLAGMTVFGIFDYVSSNVLLPVGGIFFSLFVGWKADRAFVDDQLTNGGTVNVHTRRMLFVCLRYVAPAAILIIMIFGLIK